MSSNCVYTSVMSWYHCHQILLGTYKVTLASVFCGVLVLCRQVVYRRHVYMSWYQHRHQILLRTYNVTFASVLLAVSTSCLGIIVTNSYN